MNLIAPESFLKATPEQIEEATNGAGPEGWDRLVPDTIWLLNINPAARIHDWMYTDLVMGNGFWTINHPFFGKEVFIPMSKGFADIVFLINILMMIDDANGWTILKWLRRYRATTYFNFVHDLGGFAITNVKGEGK